MDVSVIGANFIRHVRQGVDFQRAGGEKSVFDQHIHRALRAANQRQCNTLQIGAVGNQGGQLAACQVQILHRLRQVRCSGVQGKAGLVVAHLGQQLSVRQLRRLAQQGDHLGIALRLVQVFDHLGKAERKRHDRVGQVVLGGGVLFQPARLVQHLRLVFAWDWPEVEAGQPHHVGQVGQQHARAGPAGCQGDDACAHCKDTKGKDTAPIDAFVFQLFAPRPDAVIHVQDARARHLFFRFGGLLAAQCSRQFRFQGQLQSLDVRNLAAEGLAHLVERQVAAQQAGRRLKKAKDKRPIVGQHLFIVFKIGDDVEVAAQPQNVLVIENPVEINSGLHVLRVKL